MALEDLDLDGMFFSIWCHMSHLWQYIYLLKEKFSETLVSLDVKDPRIFE